MHSQNLQLETFVNWRHDALLREADRERLSQSIHPASPAGTRRPSSNRPRRLAAAWQRLAGLGS
jgi:hypothetical protein